MPGINGFNKFSLFNELLRKPRPELGGIQGRKLPTSPMTSLLHPITDDLSMTSQQD